MINPLSNLEFVKNPGSRVPCVLLLDNSSSMQSDSAGIAAIEEVNRGLRVFEQEIKQDSVARKSVEIAVVTFGGEVQTVKSFTIASEFTAPKLQANGMTPMGQGILRSIELVEARKKQYRENEIQYFRPWVFLFTDGQATDEMAVPCDTVVQAQHEKKLILWCVGAGCADFNQLARLSPGRAPLRLKTTTKFAEMFQWLSRSLTEVSRSKPGEEMQLSPPGWGSVGL